MPNWSRSRPEAPRADTDRGMLLPAPRPTGKLDDDDDDDDAVVRKFTTERARKDLQVAFLEYVNFPRSNTVSEREMKKLRLHGGIK